MLCAERAKPVFLALFLLIPSVVIPPVSQAREPSADPAKVLIPSGTPVRLQFANSIFSATSHMGDRLEFVVVRDVTAGGLAVVKAGAKAQGSVVSVWSRRRLGMRGGVEVQLDSVELANGERVGLIAGKKFSGRSHIVRMGLEMAAAGVIYLPIAPVFLLSRGGDRTVLKGTEITAYVKNDSLMAAADFQRASTDPSELQEMVELLPARAVNGAGREGDMLNLIFVAKEEDLREVFERNGWVTVETSPPQIIWHLLWQRMHYTKLPMDRLYVFGRRQDYSFALPDPGAVVAKRHHIRIWKTDRTVDGVPLWVGAATHDVGIEFVTRKLWLFHKIDPDVDAERDFIAENLAETQRLARQEYVKCVEPVVGAETATGQAYYSDNRMLLIGLTPSSAPEIATFGRAIQ
jgi:LssY C-terminus